MSKINKKVIPIVHCFNNNYVIHASVAFYSMLEHSNIESYYLLYVLHTDITIENQKKLCDSILIYKNAEIIYINMENKFSDIFKNLKNKNYFTKDMFYKLVTPSLFQQYDKIIISDVDVVYLGNFEDQFNDFDINTDFYLAGCRCPSFEKGYEVISMYEKDFSSIEIKKIYSGISAGFLIFNLKKMRDDNIESMFIDCLIMNTNRLIQPEQDVINLVCYPKIKYLEYNTLVCTYWYDFVIANKVLYNDVFTEQVISHLLDNPIQLHYAAYPYKPWNYPGCTKSDYWFYYLLKTPFFYDHMNMLTEHIKKLENQLSSVENFYLFPLRKKIKITLKHFLKKFFPWALKKIK